MRAQTVELIYPATMAAVRGMAGSFPEEEQSPPTRKYGDLLDCDHIVSMRFGFLFAKLEGFG